MVWPKLIFDKLFGRREIRVQSRSILLNVFEGNHASIPTAIIILLLIVSHGTPTSKSVFSGPRNDRYQSRGGENRGLFLGCYNIFASPKF